MSDSFYRENYVFFVPALRCSLPLLIVSSVLFLSFLLVDKIFRRRTNVVIDGPLDSREMRIYGIKIESS